MSATDINAEPSQNSKEFRRRQCCFGEGAVAAAAAAAADAAAAHAAAHVAAESRLLYRFNYGTQLDPSASELSPVRITSGFWRVVLRFRALGLGFRVGVKGWGMRIGVG